MPFPERYCRCGHSHRQHELRLGGRLGCFIWGCRCIDFEEVDPYRPYHPERR